MDELKVSDCDDDYCTGCEPGCTLEFVPYLGPDEPPFLGPPRNGLMFQMRQIYESKDLSRLFPDLVKLAR